MFLIAIHIFLLFNVLTGSAIVSVQAGAQIGEEVGNYAATFTR